MSIKKSDLYNITVCLYSFLRYLNDISYSYMIMKRTRGADCTCISFHFPSFPFLFLSIYLNACSLSFPIISLPFLYPMNKETHIRLI